MIILDLDNCISDDEWRVPFIDWKTDDMRKRYDKYHSLCLYDEFENRHLVDTHHGIIIFTARPRCYEQRTQRWLQKHGIKYEFLLMRNDNEHRHSPDLKRDQLLAVQSVGVQLEDIVAAYDDRQDVIDMYRSYGINGQLAFIHKVNTH